MWKGGAMTAHRSGWICTGLHWQDGRPVLTAENGSRVHERVLTAGMCCGWRWSGARRCTGAWTSAGRRPCPHAATVDAAATVAQCQACQNADRGLALARDRILDDGRTYTLYLAWFGTGMLKVGITAAARGTSRLLEQAALAFTIVGRGALPAVRRAELTVSRTGLARERYRSRAKTDRWWGLPGPEERRSEITELRARVLALLDGHRLDLFGDAPVTDNTALFGLTDGAPAGYREITALHDDGVLAGALHPPVGRYLFLDTPDHDVPLLLDTRLLTGRILTAAGDQHCSGLDLAERNRPEHSGTQDSLF